jgi:hypothetical protein
MRGKSSPSMFSTRQMLTASNWEEIGMISALHQSLRQEMLFASSLNLVSLMQAKDVMFTMFDD